MSERIQDQLEFPSADALLSAGMDVVIQFSKPIYSPEVLERVNKLAEIHGAKLQIRFYGHYNSYFDLSYLDYIPSVKNLAVDCLLEARNFEALDRLEALERLSIGVYNGIPDNLLSFRALGSLQCLTLAENKRNRLDLAHLSKIQSLRQLHVTGFTTSIEAIGELTSLQRLGLSQIGSKQSLSFVSQLAALRSLSVLLGGRENLDKIESKSVQDLDVVRVRGISRLNIDNFVSLRNLRIDDQIRLTALSFSGTTQDLRRIFIGNCKSLSSLDGLALLPRLDHLNIWQTALDSDEIISAGLPKSLRSFAFYGKPRSKDKLIRNKLDVLGYAEESTS